MRDRKVKRRPLPQGRLHPDLSAVPLNDLLAERQAYPCTLILLGRVQALEDGEDFIGVLHVHADAVVFDGELPPFPLCITFHADLHLWRARTSKLDRVADEVLEELGELRLVAHNHRQRSFWQRDRRLVLLDGGLEVVDGLVDNTLAVHRFERLPTARDAAGTQASP